LTILARPAQLARGSVGKFGFSAALAARGRAPPIGGCISALFARCCDEAKGALGKLGAALGNAPGAEPTGGGVLTIVARRSELARGSVGQLGRCDGSACRCLGGRPHWRRCRIGCLCGSDNRCCSWSLGRSDNRFCNGSFGGADNRCCNGSFGGCNSRCCKWYDGGSGYWAILNRTHSRGNRTISLDGSQCGCLGCSDNRRGGWGLGRCDSWRRSWGFGRCFRRCLDGSSRRRNWVLIDWAADWGRRTLHRSCYWLCNRRGRDALRLIGVKGKARLARTGISTGNANGVGYTLLGRGGLSTLARRSSDGVIIHASLVLAEVGAHVGAVPGSIATCAAKESTQDADTDRLEQDVGRLAAKVAVCNQRSTVPPLVVFLRVANESSSLRVRRSSWQTRDTQSRC
jgi:hypothetical protein